MRMIMFWVSNRCFHKRIFKFRPVVAVLKRIELGLLTFMDHGIAHNLPVEKISRIAPENEPSQPPAAAAPFVACLAVRVGRQRGQCSNSRSEFFDSSLFGRILRRQFPFEDVFGSEALEDRKQTHRFFLSISAYKTRVNSSARRMRVPSIDAHRSRI